MLVPVLVFAEALMGLAVSTSEAVPVGEGEAHEPTLLIPAGKGPAFRHHS